MKKFVKSMLAALAFAGATVIVPSVAAADDVDDCLLHAGCFHDGNSWVCSNPKIYMLCLDPDA